MILYKIFRPLILVDCSFAIAENKCPMGINSTIELLSVRVDINRWRMLSHVLLGQDESEGRKLTCFGRLGVIKT